MSFTRRIPALPAVLTALVLGVTACSEVPSTTGAVPAAGDVPVSLAISSASARIGERVAVAVKVDAPRSSTRGILGAIEFDAARLRYVGQSPEGTAISLVNDREAAKGTIRFTSFNATGISGNVALFVFETRGSGYASSLRYVHRQASGAMGDSRALKVVVADRATIDATLAVPTDVHTLTVADWSARLMPAGAERGVSLRPGEVRDGLVFGDVNYDNLVNLDDYLAVANAVVGNRQIIVGTDGPPEGVEDVDLVVAGNVHPKVSAESSCGTTSTGDRALDLDDYLEIATRAVGFTTPCAGVLIRPNVVTARQSITTTSTPSLIVAPGETVTLTNDRIWQLEGILDVQNGAVLNIQPGTRIEGLTTSPVTQAVFVRRGGQIFARGTQERPIVFTCTAEIKFKGCWGGVFIAGRGTVNLGDGVPDPATPTDAGSDGANSRVGEGNAPRYGGNLPTDNSGVIQYARFEYGGKIVGVDNELNNLTLGGVGSGTTIDHIQVHGGSDDGIEFFGGNVSTSYIVATGNDDDGFDVSFGLTGDHQFVVVQSDIGAGSNDSKAIEADGSEPAPGNILALPRTSPRLWNVTIIGDLTSRTQVAAIHLRRGSGLRLYNSIVHGYANGLDIDDPLTCNTSYGDGAIQIRNTTFVDVTRLDNSDGSDPVCEGAANEAAFITGQVSNRNITGIASILRAATNTNLPDWRMLFIGGSPAEGNTLNPNTIPGSIAVNTNFRGAVAAGDGLIPWYSGWTLPFQSASAP